MTSKKEYKYTYGKCTVKVWHTGSSWHPHPWLFSVVGPDGVEHKFAGIPNQCETKHSAIMRGWYRAKWLNEGTLHEHYKPF